MENATAPQVIVFNEESPSFNLLNYLTPGFEAWSLAVGPIVFLGEDSPHNSFPLRFQAELAPESKIIWYCTLEGKVGNHGRRLVWPSEEWYTKFPKDPEGAWEAWKKEEMKEMYKPYLQEIFNRNNGYNTAALEEAFFLGLEVAKTELKQKQKENEGTNNG